MKNCVSPLIRISRITGEMMEVLLLVVVIVGAGLIIAIVNNSTSIHIETPGETLANNSEAIPTVVMLFLVAAFIMTVIAIANKWLLKR